jgi:electron transfer flavoprotein alpha subunit
MATVRPGVMSALGKETRKGDVTEFKIDFVPTDQNVKILKTVKQEKKLKDITEAKILVSGGRGIGPDFAVLKPLADVLGAEISSSRAQVDLGRAEKDRQVGQTGKTVRPNVYFALGISGAIQHVAGMEGSDLIIAVNKDAGAQIFNYADLGVVGDVHKVLPKLVDLLKKERSK